MKTAFYFALGFLGITLFGIGSNVPWWGTLLADCVFIFGFLCGLVSK